MELDTLRRKAGTAALSAFRVLPVRLKRVLVRTGTPNYTVGAVCVLEHEGRVLFLSQPHRRGWSLPGGLLDRGETPAQAVAREVREEVGLLIDPGDPLVTGVHQRTQSVDVVFRVPLERRPELSLAHEARRARWWDPATLRGADLETRQILVLVRAAHAPSRPGSLAGEG